MAFVVYFTCLGMLYVIPPLAVEWGYSKEMGALVITIGAACEFIQRIFLFPLTGYFNVNMYKYTNVCLLSAISGLVAVYFSTYPALVVHGIVNGFLALMFCPIMTILIKVCTENTSQN